VRRRGARRTKRYSAGWTESAVGGKLTGVIAIRRAATDADLNAWIHVRRLVVPDESAGTVESQRARESAERLLVVAELDGALAGSGYCDRSDLGDRFSLAPRVLPEMRRRGVGTALLECLAAHAARFEVDKVSATVEDEGSRAFAERFGFRERDRQLEQVKRLGSESPPQAAAEELEIVTVAERPELLEAVYPLALEGYADMATERRATISLEDWLREDATLPEGSYVALAAGEVVGYSGLRGHDNPGTVEDGLTVVRRDWRRRGLATLLKELELAWAGEHGYREVVTWTQQGNERMRLLNEKLGYAYRTVSVTMAARLPLREPV
jgi:mycothiol synthase